MATSTAQRLRGLVLSANEIKDLTAWPEAMVEDYLNIIDNFILLAGIIDFNNHITTDLEYGPGLLVFQFGDDTPEHRNMVGSYDHTGGAKENLFTKTSGDDFTQEDADKANWIFLTGINTGAIAEIKLFIDANNVMVKGLGWDKDFVSQTFNIFKHPSFVTGEGYEHEFSVGPDGEFEVRGYDFVGSKVGHFIFNAAADLVNGLVTTANAEGYNAVQAALTEYISGDLPTANSGRAHTARLDVSEAVNADINTQVDAYTASVVNGSPATTTGVKVLPGFTNAIEVQGAPSIDPGYGYDVDNSLAIVTDRVTGVAPAGTAFLDSSATNVTLFSAVTDYILIGSDNTFEVVEYTNVISSSKSITPSFEFSTGAGTWATLPILADGTNGFQQSGQISFIAPGPWAKGNEAEVGGDITNAYYVRITRTRIAVIATLPIESHFNIYASREQGMKVLGDGSVHPATLADADAENETIYYSTNSSKLVYKDGGGVVNDLY